MRAKNAPWAYLSGGALPPEVAYAIEVRGLAEVRDSPGARSPTDPVPAYSGTVVRIDPYSHHRQFYWVELDLDVEAMQGGRTRLVSVFNPKNIKKNSQD